MKMSQGPEFPHRFDTNYQGLLWATSILTLSEKLSPQAHFVGFFLVLSKVWRAEICFSVFQYGLGQWLFMTEKCFKIRLFFLVKHVKLCILSFSLCEEQKNSHSAKHELYNLTCFTKKNSRMSKHFSVINKHWPRPYWNTLEHNSAHHTFGVLAHNVQRLQITDLRPKTTLCMYISDYCLKCFNWKIKIINFYYSDFWKLLWTVSSSK